MDGKVIPFPQRVLETNVVQHDNCNPTPLDRSNASAYSYVVNGNDYSFNVIVERDIESLLWTWRAVAYVGNSSEPMECGTYPKLLMSLQEEPMLLYSEPEAAYGVARLIIGSFDPKT